MALECPTCPCLAARREITGRIAKGMSHPRAAKKLPPKPHRRIDHGSSVSFANNSVGLPHVRARGCDRHGVNGRRVGRNTDNWHHGEMFPFPHHGAFQGHPTPVGQVQVIASGLNQPKKITVAPDGSLLVALSGDVAAPASCTDGAEPSCLDNSGAIVRVTPGGQVSTVLGNLPSISSGGGSEESGPPSATGPVEAFYQNGGLQVLFQNTGIDPTTGQETYGPAGTFLGDLVQFRSFGSASQQGRSSLRSIRSGQQSRSR